MSIKSAPYYWVECDDCGAKSTEGGEHSAWSEGDMAWEEAYNSDWGAVDGKHYCDGCFDEHDPDRQIPACGAQTSLFGLELSCEREQGHKGQHQQAVVQTFKDKQVPSWASWSDGSGGLSADKGFTACLQCGAMHDPRAHYGDSPERPCFHCRFWNELVEEYNKGKRLIIDGTSYAWGNEQGFGGRTFTVTTAEGTVTRKGLWYQGKIPWEFRDLMPDNAAFGTTFPKEQTND